MKKLLLTTSLILLTSSNYSLASNSSKSSLNDLIINGNSGRTISQRDIIHHRINTKDKTIIAKPGSTHVIRGHNKSRNSRHLTITNGSSRNIASGTSLNIRGNNARIIFSGYVMTNQNHLIVTDTTGKGLATGTLSNIQCSRCTVSGTLFQRNFGSVIRR